MRNRAEETGRAGVSVTKTERARCVTWEEKGGRKSGEQASITCFGGKGAPSQESEANYLKKQRESPELYYQGRTNIRQKGRDRNDDPTVEGMSTIIS